MRRTYTAQYTMTRIAGFMPPRSQEDVQIHEMFLPWKGYFKFMHDLKVEISHKMVTSFSGIPE